MTWFLTAGPERLERSQTCHCRSTLGWFLASDSGCFYKLVILELHLVFGLRKRPVIFCKQFCGYILKQQMIRSNTSWFFQANCGTGIARCAPGVQWERKWLHQRHGNGCKNVWGWRWLRLLPVFTCVCMVVMYAFQRMCVCGDVTEPTVRAELMEQVPNIAMFLHENRPNFPEAFSRYLVPIVVRYLTDPNNQVSDTCELRLKLNRCIHYNIELFCFHKASKYKKRKRKEKFLRFSCVLNVSVLKMQKREGHLRVTQI